MSDSQFPDTNYLKRSGQKFEKTDLKTLTNLDMKINSTTGASFDYSIPDAHIGKLTAKPPVHKSNVSASAATVTLVPIYKNEVYEQAVGAAMTINITKTNAEIGDLVILKLANDGTQRTVTLGTNVKPSGTVVGEVNKTINVTLMFDGTNYVEIARSAAYTP